MRTIPGYPDPRTVVTSPAARFIWADKAHEVLQMSVTRELGTGLPAQVAGVNGMVAATGSATVRTNGMDVSEGLHLPWESSGPKLGDNASLEAGLHDSLGVERRGRLLTGRVDATSGDVSGPELSVDLVDWIDNFNRNISINPLHYRHPPQADEAPLMQMGLHPSYVTDRVARHCGFYATPRLLTSNSVVSAPLMGSAWPERGDLVLADPADGGAPGSVAYPKYGSTAWGLAVENIEAQWTPYILPGFTGKFDRPTYVRFLTGPVKDAYSRVYLKTEGTAFTNSFAVSVSRERGVDVAMLANLGEDVQAGTPARFGMPLTADEIASGVDVVVWLVPEGTNARVTIGVRSSEDGPVRTASGTIPASSVVRNVPLQMVHLYSPTAACLIGGLQVGFAAAPFDLHAWKRTAIIETDPVGQLLGVPALVNRNCLELLKEQAAAELAAMWIDQSGRFRYRSHGRLLTEPVSDEITIDDLHGVKWSTNWSSVHSSVGVKFQHPSVARHRTYRATAWEGQSITLEGSDVYEEIIHPEDGVDWINVGPLRLVDDADPNSIYRYNLGRGSFVAGVVEYEDAEGNQQSFPANYLYMAASLTRIDARSYLFRVESKNLPAGYTLNLRVPGWKKVWWSRLNRAMPIVRANIVQRWDELQVTGLPLGVASAGTYEHDASWWVQEYQPAQALADSLAEYTEKPVPQLSDVSVVPDDRRELGDVYRVRIQNTVLRCLCVAITDEMTDSGRSQTLALQPIEIEEN